MLLLTITLRSVTLTTVTLLTVTSLSHLSVSHCFVVSRLIWTRLISQCDIWSGSDDEICLHIRVSGFSDKALLLLTEVLQHLVSYTPTQAPLQPPAHDHTSLHTPEQLLCGQLARQIEVLSSFYANGSVTAGTASRARRLNHLLVHQVPLATRLHALNQLKERLSAQTVTLPDLAGTLRGYVHRFLKESYVVSLLQGNVSEGAAVAFGKQLAMLLSTGVGVGVAPCSQDAMVTAASTTTSTHGEVVSLPKSCVMVQNPRTRRRVAGQVIRRVTNQLPALHTLPSNPLETNRAVEVYFQLGSYSNHSRDSMTSATSCSQQQQQQTHSPGSLPVSVPLPELSELSELPELPLKDVVLLELLDQVISEPFFDQLRTNQQVTTGRLDCVALDCIVL